MIKIDMHYLIGDAEEDQQTGANHHQQTPARPGRVQS